MVTLTVRVGIHRRPPHAQESGNHLAVEIEPERESSGRRRAPCSHRAAPRHLRPTTRVGYVQQDTRLTCLAGLWQRWRSPFFKRSDDEG